MDRDITFLALRRIAAAVLLSGAGAFVAVACTAESRIGGVTDTQNSNDVGGSGSGSKVLEENGGSIAQVDFPERDAGGEPFVIDVAPDAACVATGFEAVPIEVEKEVEVPVEVPQPVALYIMLDQSSSMLDSVSGIPFVPPYKWNVAYDAITAFVRDPESTDLDVAIQYFPLGAVRLSDPDAGVPSEVPAECQGTEYATADVPMGRLPGNAQAIIDSLNFHFPAGSGTPIEPALRGAVNFCNQYMNGNSSGEKCVVVLITDGLPTACNGDFSTLAGIASEGFNSDPSVKTYAIGMIGADFTLLNQIGQNGGTDCAPSDSQTFACDVTAGMTLLEAFELIREYIVETRVEIRVETQYVKLDCQWEIPPPPEGETFDREKVNVEFSSTGLESDKRYLAKVESEDKCEGELAWYYDDPQDPKQIIACPTACSLIEEADLGKIRVLLGCESMVIE
ncbi:MAG: VWA domain-containing protein [Deltaproteobacteria bacterium]|nr:VWA domain-containing protein [Deltaproteobacteria bacterium]